MIDKKHLVELTQTLINIRSDNPESSEREIASFVKKFLLDLGLKPRIYEFKKNRSNVVASLRGSNSNLNLLVTPHLDTVTAGNNWKYPPFKAVINKGKIYGRGASDDKGNLAVSLAVIKSLIEENQMLGYNLVFAATADEETGSKFGLIPLLARGILKPQAALILDVDEFKIIVAQKGLLHLKIKIQGKAAHGAYPWQGINAVDLAVKIIREIKSYHFNCKKNSYLRAPTINIGRINGGDKVNIVAGWCDFEIDVRFLPGEQGDDILPKIKRIIRRQAKTAKIQILAQQDPTQINCRHFLVNRLKKAMLELGVKPRITGSEGATVITFFQQRNIPAIATGFASSGCAHAGNEYVKIKHLHKGALVLENFLKNFNFR